jgi:hypothetical protein
MKKRVVTKIGDIFSVQVSDKKKKFFQLIAFDLTQLNSDVIRAFNQEYANEENPDFSEIVKNDVQFYAHCVTSVGVKLGFWEKVGKSNDVGKLNHILFRGTEDYARKPDEEPVRVSENWYVWRIGGRFTDVGKLEGENRRAEIGLVFNPESIVHRIKTGKYKWVYPDFE